jgi:tripartite-type tricarboxylate transporter receptor subunit TctC
VVHDRRAGKDVEGIIAKLNASVDKFLKTGDGIARLRKLGAEPAGRSPEDMQAYVLRGNREVGQGREIRRHQAGVMIEA